MNTTDETAEAELETPPQGQEEAVEAENALLPPPAETRETETNPEISNSRAREELRVIAGHILEVKERSRETHYLAESLTQILNSLSSQEAQSEIAEAIRNHRCFEVSSPEESAREIIYLEEQIIAPLKAKIEQAGTIPPEKIEGTLSSVREAFYGIVLNEVLTGQKIKDLIGDTYYKEKPDTSAGGEAEGETYDPDKITAYFRQNQNGKIDIFLYNKFFEENAPAQSQIIRHEFSHLLAEGTMLWKKEIYDSFLEYAKNPTDAQIQDLESRDCPELAEVLKVIQNPAAHLGLSNYYIRERLKTLQGLPEGEPKAQERQRVAQELVAERISSFLQVKDDEIAFLSTRMAFRHPSEFIKVLQEISGTSNLAEFKGFCAERGVMIDPRNQTPKELIEALSKIKEFAPIFLANKIWIARLKEGFSGRGEKIALRREPTYAHAAEFEEWEYLGGLADDSPNYTGASQADYRQSPQSASSGNFIKAFWDFITGENQTSGSLPNSSKDRLRR